MAEPVGMLRARARALREGRDRWHREAREVVTALRAAGDTLDAIATETGIPRATAARLSDTSGNTSSAVAP